MVEMLADLQVVVQAQVDLAEEVPEVEVQVAVADLGVEEVQEVDEEAEVEVEAEAVQAAEEAVAEVEAEVVEDNLTIKRETEFPFLFCLKSIHKTNKKNTDSLVHIFWVTEGRSGYSRCRETAARLHRIPRSERSD